MKKLVGCLVLLTLSIGCVESTSDKGTEESPLTDGKADSFFQPTLHGPLQFGVENPATVRTDEVFHAWTFELSGEATVTLKTNISDNLDTVMYLYRRDPGDSRWGRFKRKNDDFDGNLWSQITHNGDAAEYRVVVKPFKTSLRGTFSVDGTCEGDGCTSPSDGQCEAGEFEALPAFTRYSDGCTSRLTRVLTSEVQFETSGFAPVQNHCGVAGIPQKALAHYHEFWEDIVGFEDAFGPFFDDEPFELNFEHRALEHGDVVSVDTGGDEDGLTMIYDEDGELLAAYQHNQSPTVEYFCANDNEEQFEGPFAECFSPIMNGLTFSDSDVTELVVETLTLDEIKSLDLLGVEFAATNYEEIFEERLFPNQRVDFTYREYGSVDGILGSEIIMITVDDDLFEVEAKYTTLADDPDRPIVIRESDDNEVFCE